jgi:hypothetical protein
MVFFISEGQTGRLDGFPFFLSMVTAGSMIFLWRSPL